MEIKVNNKYVFSLFTLFLKEGKREKKKEKTSEREKQK